MSDKTDKTGIDKIDKTLYEKGVANGLNIKDIKFCGDLIEGKSQTEAYQDNIAKENTLPETTRVKASLKTKKDKIQKTIKEVLIQNKITKDSVIKTHQIILNKAIDINQLSTAEKANTKFMQLLGIDTYQPPTTNNIQVNIDKLSIEQVNDRLKDIITL